MELELELETQPLRGYETVLETTVFREETLEAIVPDACPDIQRIVDTEARVELGNREAQEGRAEVSGTVRATVLYLPEGGGGVRKLEVSLPFVCAAEGPGVRGNCTVLAVPRVVSAETRSLNPRKVLTRVEVAAEVQVFVPSQRQLAGGAVCPPELGVEQLRQEEGTYGPVCTGEKPFPFADTLTIPASRPAAEELLRWRVSPVCGEAKVIGSKLIFKGTVFFRLLYRAAGDEVCTAVFELPFSQIMEAPEAGEGCDVSLEVTPLSADCVPEGGEGRELRVELELLAQAVFRARRPVTLLADLYSTVYEGESEGEIVPLEELVERGVRRETVREVVETGVEVGTVCDVWAAVGRLSQSREGPRLKLEAEAEVLALCRTADGTLETVSRRFTVRCPLELEEGCPCVWVCREGQELQASPVAGGLELRFSLDFRYLAKRVRQVRVLSAARLDQEKLRDRADQPSIVLRLAGPGEALWDVAKAYATTERDICQANGLEDGVLPAGQLLLIPRKRRVEG